MKRVLIAGSGSYIGQRLTAWLERFPDRFETQPLSLRGDGWKTFDFHGFDAVVLVAGLAHRRETPQDAPLYDAVNHTLAVQVAQVVKAAGVGQFVFFSSMSVYGLTVGRVHAHTEPRPKTAYGISKLAAERDLFALGSGTFHIATLRPPMVYGRGCRGNYPRLSALVCRLPVFPRVKNERSMLYIDTLCAFLQALLESGEGGLYFPQNRAYVSTTELARQIALAHSRRLWQPAGLGWLLTALSRRVETIGKVFGTLTYDQSMSDAFRPATETALPDSVRQTEAEP
jgi:nucleoside-diphosphate-sugar epimerase